jgi:hypothetical protein
LQCDRISAADRIMPALYDAYLPQERINLRFGSRHFCQHQSDFSHGFEVDVIVSADIVAFYRVWLGRVSLSEALHRQQVRLDGTPADVRAFSGWFAWSLMADTVRAALANRRTASNDRHRKLTKRSAG